MHRRRRVGSERIQKAKGREAHEFENSGHTSVRVTVPDLAAVPPFKLPEADRETTGEVALRTTAARSLELET
eukprot:scaffold146_cov265-Pinguiococcus_pyrenoidosus.AAC.42